MGATKPGYYKMTEPLENETPPSDRPPAEAAPRGWQKVQIEFEVRDTTVANELAATIQSAVYKALHDYGVEHAKGVKFDVFDI